MTARKIKKSWWVDFSHDLTRYRKRSPANSKAGAEAYEAVLRQKLARGESLERQNQDLDAQQQTFDRFAWEWFETYVKTNNKPSEISRKKFALRCHLVPFFGRIPVNKISSLQIEQYKANTLRKGLSQKSINNTLGVLRKSLNSAQEWLDLEKIPKIKMLKVPPSKFDFLTPTECKLVLANSEGIWREIILTAIKTGLRHGELKALDWADLNWNTKKITVRHSWCEYKKDLVSPKSNRERHIPMDGELHDILAKRKKTTGYVFLDERGEKFSSHRLNQEITAACRKAGIEREITCHRLRHTFASHLTMAGVPFKAIQELMGHASITTTMRYAHLAPSGLTEAVDKLPAIMDMPFGLGQPVGNRDANEVSV